MSVALLSLLAILNGVGGDSISVSSPSIMKRP